MATLEDFKPLELEKNDEREKIGTSLDEFKLEETDKGQKTDFVR
jgi:hypothetical protein